MKNKYKEASTFFKHMDVGDMLVLKDAIFEVVKNESNDNCENCDINIKNRISSNRSKSCSEYVAESVPIDLNKTFQLAPCTRTTRHFKRVTDGL